MSSGPIQQPQNQAAKATFAQRFDEMIDALESLYIAGNQSGRIQFRTAWPLLAPRVFGDELIGFDEKGVTDRERRAVLEVEADDRRIALIAEILEIREKSIKNSMLELDYIKATMQKYGRDFAALIYAETLMDKFMPAPASERAATPVEEKPVAAPVFTDIPVEIPDDVAPIAMSAPEQAAPVPAKPAIDLKGLFNRVAA